jgi:uncharacterized DUF497 family protein
VQFDGFDWDVGNRETCQKHDVSIAEIEEVLRSIRFVIDDPSPTEKRYRTVGKTSAGRHVFAVFTLRGTKLRPVSVRYMHEKEVRAYEEGMAGREDR